MGATRANDLVTARTDTDNAGAAAAAYERMRTASEIVWESTDQKVGTGSAPTIALNDYGRWWAGAIAAGSHSASGQRTERTAPEQGNKNEKYGGRADIAVTD